MAEVLTSWKEIADYLGKGVRTVQRWERELGLPVRRPKPKQKHIVIAFREELDSWLRNEAHQAVNVGERSPELQRLRVLMASMVEQAEKLRQNTELLRSAAAKHTANQRSKEHGGKNAEAPLKRSNPSDRE